MAVTRTEFEDIIQRLCEASSTLHFKIKRVVFVCNSTKKNLFVCRFAGRFRQFLCSVTVLVKNGNVIGSGRGPAKPLRSVVDCRPRDSTRMCTSPAPWQS